MASLTRLQRYGIAVAGVILIAVLRLALDSILREDLPLFLFVFPIILAGWYGGLGPGLLATLLSLVLGAREMVFQQGNPHFMRGVVLAFIGTSFSILFDRTQKAIKAHLACLERFRLLVESAKDYAIFTLDPAGRVTCWNAGAEEMKGYEEHEVMGRDFSVFYTPEDRERGKPEKDLEIAATQGRYEEECWQTRRDGTRFWSSGVITPLRDERGQLRGFAKITRDITKRKRDDETLLRNQRFVQQIIDVSPSVIYIYDVAQMKHVFVNRSIATALGYSSEQDLQDTDLPRSVIHPDDWQRFLEHVNRVAALSDEETADCEYRMRHKSGAWRSFHSRDKVFGRNEDSSVREIIGTATDITDLKAAETETRFMGDLNQAILPLGDPDQIMTIAVRMLGEYLEADRCGYAEVDREDQFVVMGDYVRGETSSIVGRYRMSEFGENERRVLRENRPYVVNDIEVETPKGAELSLYRRGQIRSLVCVPLNKDGYSVARMAVHYSKPHYWTNHEIELVTTVANRCWESVARARAARNLKESDERYRSFIANSSEAIWRFELERPIPITLPEDEQVELLFQFAYLAECNDAMARMYGYDKANEIVGARLGDLLVKSDPQNIAFLHAFKQAGYRLTDVETREVDRYGNIKYFLNNLNGVQENEVMVRGWGMQRDITNQKQAEKDLRESEERYRLLTQLSPDGVVIASADGTIRLANPSLLRMLGTTLESVNGRNLFNFVAPEFQSYCRDWLSKLTTNGTSAAQVDTTFNSEDGRQVAVEFSAVRFEWKGQPSAQIVVHDLTGRKQAEADRERWLAEIESERNRLQQILQQMPMGVAIAEAPSGRLLFHNLEAERLLRHTFLSAEDYRGYVKYGALHEDGRPFTPEEYPMTRSLISGEVIKGEEIRYRRGDGTDTVFSVGAAPIYDAAGRMVLSVVTFMDIAERKAADLALRESEQRFAMAFRATPDAMVISRIADGVILEVNDSFVSLTGYTRDELIGNSTLSLGLYADISDRERAVAILKERNRVRDLELVIKRKTGELRLMMFSAEALDLHGEHCWLTIGRDITQLRQVEKQRERLLLQEKAAREEAEAANQMKDEFLATISHELRTPLTSILGWARMLNSGKLTESQIQHAHQVIEQSANAQARLVNDILDTAGMVAGRFKLDARPVEMEQVFRAAIDVIRPAADAKKINLRVLIDEGDSIVRGDANRLQQAIWNLLSNAVKFTGEGGRVEARLTHSGSQVEISISDSGIGIDQQFLPYIFDRFRQADSTSTRRYGGLGLGLAIVRYVIEMHGGSISASSPGIGQGATFAIRIPAASAQRAEHETDRRHESQLRQPVEGKEERLKLLGLRLLVVEDDPDTLDLLSFVFEENGAHVIAAGSVNDALNALDRSRPDVLVSDLAMPEKDGYDLIMQVRSRSSDKGGNIPAVALSAYTRAEDRSRALAAGFQVHVSKPVDPKRLVAVVASLTGVPH